jgi:hypothetical protein
MSANSQGGGRQRQSARSKEQSAMMKRLGICRTTGRCAVCYQLIQIESWKSKYRHVCRG